MVDDLKRWRNIPDDFVLPVPEVARILDVSEEAIYAGATNGFYFLVAPCDRPALAVDFTFSLGKEYSSEEEMNEDIFSWEKWPQWIELSSSDVAQWIFSKKINMQERRKEAFFYRHNVFLHFLDTTPLRPPFLGVSGALLKRFLNEGFPPPADSPRVQEIEPPPREDVRETMRAIIAGLLEEAGAAFLIERPTEAEVSKASALLEAIERRRGKAITPKTLSRYLRNWLRAED